MSFDGNLNLASLLDIDENDPLLNHFDGNETKESWHSNLSPNNNINTDEMHQENINYQEVNPPLDLGFFKGSDEEMEKAMNELDKLLDNIGNQEDNSSSIIQNTVKNEEIPSFPFTLDADRNAINNTQTYEMQYPEPSDVPHILEKQPSIKRKSTSARHNSMFIPQKSRKKLNTIRDNIANSSFKTDSDAPFSIAELTPEQSQSPESVISTISDSNINTSTNIINNTSEEKKHTTQPSNSQSTSTVNSTTNHRNINLESITSAAVKEMKERIISSHSLITTYTALKNAYVNVCSQVKETNLILEKTEINNNKLKIENLKLKQENKQLKLKFQEISKKLIIKETTS